MAKAPQTKLRPSLKQQNQKLKDDLDLDLESDAIETDERQSGQTKTYTRNFSGKKDILTDLFKLSVAPVIKYEGWDEANEHPDTQPAKFSHWEHTHPFRTYGKKGEKLTMSTPIGGHFHIVEWEPSQNSEEPPIIKSVSGPMVMGKKKVKGKVVQMPVPANEYDDHTHDVEYISTSQIQFSTANLEAQKVIAFEANKTAPVPGVLER